MTAPHTDRYERRLFPPEQSLANDKIDRPAIYLYGNEATKFRDQPSRFTHRGRVFPPLNISDNVANMLDGLPGSIPLWAHLHELALSDSLLLVLLWLRLESSRLRALSQFRPHGDNSAVAFAC